MEELTKTQILLLTLLVSFVTSIATGIITVALMDQAPAGVTQTVNRVVERTIERVVPEKNGATVITKEVVVKEDNLITDAIGAISKSMVRIKKTITTTDGGTASVAVSLGAIISKEGTIVTDAGFIEENTVYRASLPGGSDVGLKLAFFENGVAFFNTVEETKFDFIPIKFADSASVKLGQTAISLYGREKNTVAIGIISAIRNTDDKKEYYESNLSLGDVYGNTFMNLFGEVVGVRSSIAENYIVSSDTILKILKSKEKSTAQ